MGPLILILNLLKMFHSILTKVSLLSQSHPAPLSIQYFPLDRQSLRKFQVFLFPLPFKVIQTHIKCLLLQFTHLNL